ncbi:MAG: response regulator [Spirochaetales bacterium]|nr:response regulator [Spirochaetales bacterium]
MPYHIFHLLALFVSIILIANAWHNRWDPKSYYFFLYTICLAFWVFTDFLATSSHMIRLKLFLSRLEYFGVSFLPFFYLAIVIHVVMKKSLIRRKFVFLLVPVVLLAFILTNDYHNLFYTQVSLILSGRLILLQFSWGPLFYVFVSINLLLELFAFALLLQYAWKASYLKRMQALFLSFACLFPTAASILFVFGIFDSTTQDLIQVIYIVSAIFITIAFYRYRLLEIIPFAKDKILDSLHDIMLITDINGGIMYMNRPGKDLFEYDESRRKTFKQLLPDVPEKQEALKNYLKNNTIRDNYYILNYTDLLDGRNRKTGRLYLFRNITDRVLDTMALKKAKEDAESANDEKTKFLATVSHEIRTPMNAIIGMAELTLDSELNDEQRSNIEIVKTSAESLLFLLNDILDFSRIEAGRMTLEIVDFDLHTFLRDCTRTFYQSARMKNLQLVCDLEPSLPRIVKGDYQRLRQVLVNLLNNALKFTEQGSISVIGEYLKTDTDALDRIMHSIRITVKDTGVGIPPDKLHLIFRDFSQANTSVSRKYGGTGLGLAISQGIITLMDGTIEVKSKENAGTSFVINLTLEQGDRRQLIRKGPEKISSGHVSGIFILLVEDNTVNTNLARRYLQKYGHHVVCCSSGEDALKELEHVSPDLILMDIEMPGGIDGIETTERIRETEKKRNTPSVPIVGMSAYSHKEVIEKGKAAGMNEYITKPVNFRKLQEMINSIMAGKEIKRDRTTEIVERELLDLQKVISAVGYDPEFLEEMVKNYLTSSEDYFSNLQNGIKENNLEMVAKYAHSFAGSSLTIGANKIGTTCRAVEDAARNGENETVTRLSVKLENEYREIMEYCLKLNFSQNPLHKDWQ